MLDQVRDALTDPAARRRGLFRDQAVQALLADPNRTRTHARLERAVAARPAGDVAAAARGRLTVGHDHELLGSVNPVPAWRRAPSPSLAEAVRLGHALVDAWGSWAPTLSPDCAQVAFVSDRTGSPRLFVQDLVPPSDRAGETPEARMVELSDDPVVEVSWSADGGWLACALATGGGVKTQVWIVRPDGSDARRIAGSETVHAQLGPWTRSGHRVTITVPGEQVGEPARAYLVDPANGEMYALADGELISVLDLSVDEDYVVLKDGQRGKQFCVVVDRVADADHPLLPYPATGSTDRAFVRPAPPGDPLPANHPAGLEPLIAYLATDAGLPRRQLVAIPLGPAGWRGQSGVLAPRPDAELEGLDADDAGRRLLLLWNVAGGRSELEILDAWTGEGEVVEGVPGAVITGMLISRDGSTALMAVEGPERPRELWALDVACRTWWLATATPPRTGRRLVTPTLEFLHGRDGLPLTGWLYRPPGSFGPGPAILSLHGGPEAQERPTFNPQHQAVAAAGIAVFAPNIRGSSGSGRAFVHADDVHGRRDAFDDVLACEDFLVVVGRRGAGPGRGERALVRRLPDPRDARVRPGRVRGRDRHLRDVRPAHVLPRHRAVDRRGRGHQVRRPGTRLGAAARAVADAAGREHRRPAARRARRARHERPVHRGDPGRRRAAGARPARGVPAAGR